MQGYAQEICRTWFLVGLRIEVDAPGVLAALRPCMKVGIGISLWTLDCRAIIYPKLNGPIPIE